MVVSVCLHAPDGVVLFEVVVFDQLVQKLTVKGHLLETRKQTRILAYLCKLWAVHAHKLMRTDVLDSEALLRVSIQNLRDEVFALG